MIRRAVAALVSMLTLTLGGCEGAASPTDQAPSGDPAVAAAAGGRHRSAVAACTENDREARIVDPSPDRARGLLDHLLPPDEQPTGALVCRYAGERVVVARRLDAAGARRLADVVRRAPASAAGPGVRSCANADGRRTVVSLDYQQGAPSLLITESGCRTATNGLFTTGDVDALLQALPRT